MDTFKFIVFALILSQVVVSFPTQVQKVQEFAANQSCTEDCCRSLPARPPMTYYFYQNTGRFRGGLGQSSIDTYGYSGQGEGYLNPDYQCVENVGPLPATIYKLTYCKNTMHNPPVPRPCSFYLQPQQQDEMCGQSDFFIHGCQCCTPQDDTIPPVNGCSAGCIVINYVNRKKLRVGDTIIVQHYEPKLVEEETQ